MAVVDDLLQTLKDGEEGYAAAAKTLEKDGATDLSNALQSYSEQRAAAITELQGVAGGEAKGSLLAAAHRGWLSLKDAVTGEDAASVLGNADRGDEHAIAQFEKALDDPELPTEAKPVVAKQLDDIRRVKSEIGVFRRSLPS